MGKSLVGPVLALGTWALEHIGDIAAPQMEFDVKQQNAR
jgi:hypothetical protein